MKVWIKVHSGPLTASIAQWLTIHNVVYVANEIDGGILFFDSAQYTTLITIKFSVAVEEFATVSDLLAVAQHTVYRIG